MKRRDAETRRGRGGEMKRRGAEGKGDREIGQIVEIGCEGSCFL